MTSAKTSPRRIYGRPINGDRISPLGAADGPSYEDVENKVITARKLRPQAEAGGCRIQPDIAETIEVTAALRFLIAEETEDRRGAWQSAADLPDPHPSGVHRQRAVHHPANKVRTVRLRFEQAVARKLSSS